MMYIFFEIATVLIELLFIHIYLHGIFLQYKKSGLYIFASYFFCGIILSILSLIPINPFIRLAAICLTVTVLTMFTFNAKILSAFYASLILCIINVVVDSICSALITAFGIPFDTLLVFGNNRIIFVVIAKLVQLFFFYLVIKLSNWHRENESLISAVPLLLCQVFSIFICHIMLLGVYKNNSSITLSFVMGAIGVLYINIIIFLYVERMKSIFEIRRQNELAEQQFKSELEYFNHLKNDQEETRALWHDISKYLNTMKALIDSNDIYHAKECMDQATEVFSDIGNVVDVGNTVINAVLNQRVQKARRMSIDTLLDIRVEKEVEVSSADLSIIIGNTIDNAIEACSMLPDEIRQITIRINQMAKIFYYEIENPYIESAANPKNNRKIRGYGLKNVKRCVDKYKGHMDIEKSDGAFKVSIHLNT